MYIVIYFAYFTSSQIIIIIDDRIIMIIDTHKDDIKNDDEYKEIYGDLNYRVTLLLHRLES